MSQYDIPIIGGIARAVNGAFNPNATSPNQTAEQQTAAQQAIGANALLSGVINKYNPANNPGNAAMSSALGTNNQAAQAVTAYGNEQMVAGNPGFNSQLANSAIFGNLAQNGSQAAMQQLRQGQQQQVNQTLSAAHSNSAGMSPAMLAANLQGVQAQQGQQNAMARQQLTAQGQLAGQNLAGTAAGQYGSSLNNAYGAAQAGLTAAATANNNALGTQGNYLLGQQSNNQDYLNTLGAVGNAAYNANNSYAQNQMQGTGNAAKTAGSVLAALF